MASRSQRRSYVPAGAIDYLHPAHFFALLKSHDTTFFTGVPDSFLKNFCAYITDTVDEKDHIIAENERAAMSLAAGHHLATGKIACVYLQDFTSGNTVNPPLSLLSPKADSTPTLMLIGWGGEAGETDEPPPELVRKMDIPFDVLPDYAEGAFKVLDKAYKYMETEKGPYAMLVRRETFGKN